jgi:Xaa-Pro dipeptidase
VEVTVRHRAQRILDAASVPLDAVVLMNGRMPFSDSTFRYVSGVTRGGYENCAAVLLPGEKPALVVSDLERESALTAPDSEIHAYASQAAQRGILTTLLGDARRIGVHGQGIVKARADELAETFPEAEIVDVTAAVNAARLVKDAEEIALIRAACALTSDVAARIPSMLREGMTEVDLSSAIAAAIREGGGKNAFDTIACFGANGSEPHYSPGDVPLRPGDMILTDFGAELAGYCSDITRMFVFGTASPEQRAMFDVVRSAQKTGLELTTSGVEAREVHRRVREEIDATEFAGKFIHGTGHSIGLDVHDGGGLNDASEIVLEPGMVMTVEPGVYVPGVGGVRIEDTVVVTEGGPDILTPVTKDLVETGA